MEPERNPNGTRTEPERNPNGTRTKPLPEPWLLLAVALLFLELSSCYRVSNRSHSELYRPYEPIYSNPLPNHKLAVISRTAPLENQSNHKMCESIAAYPSPSPLNHEIINHDAPRSSSEPPIAIISIDAFLYSLLSPNHLVVFLMNLRCIQRIVFSLKEQYRTEL